jgi:hypothetical protein
LVGALFPRGPEGAHGVRNETERTARVLMFSTVIVPTATVYPASDKVGIWTGDPAIDVMVRGAARGRPRRRRRAFERLVEPYRRELHAHCCTWIEGEQTHVPSSLDVLSLEGEKIKEITAFVVRTADTPDGYSRWPEYAADASRVQAVFKRFGLPDRMD